MEHGRIIKLFFCCLASFWISYDCFVFVWVFFFFGKRKDKLQKDCFSCFLKCQNLPDTTLQKLFGGVNRMQRSRSTHSRTLLSTCVHLQLFFVLFCCWALCASACSLDIVHLWVIQSDSVTVKFQATKHNLNFCMFRTILAQNKLTIGFATQIAFYTFGRSENSLIKSKPSIRKGKKKEFKWHWTWRCSGWRVWFHKEESEKMTNECLLIVYKLVLRHL